MEYMSINIFWYKFLDVGCSVLFNEKEMMDFLLLSCFFFEFRNCFGLKCFGFVNMLLLFMIEFKYG